MPLAAEARVTIEAIGVAVMGLFLYRFGALATLIAFLVMFGVPPAADLIWSGGDPFVTSGVAAVALLLVPGGARDSRVSAEAAASVNVNRS